MRVWRRLAPDVAALIRATNSWSRLRRQDRDRLDLEQKGRVGEPRHLHQGRGGQRRLVREVGAAHLAELYSVRLDVDQVAVEIDHVLEAAADRGERGLE